MKPLKVSLAICLLTFFVAAVFERITSSPLFKYIIPEKFALEEFDYTDFVFLRRVNGLTPEKRIVLVNIPGTRREVARQISTISHFKPRVIAVDAFFNCAADERDSVNCPQLLDTLGNEMLSDAIRRAGNAVLVVRMLTSEALEREGQRNVYDSAEYSDSTFTNHAFHGFANLPTQGPADYLKICRSFVPRLQFEGKDYNAFTVEVARLYDSSSVKRLFSRKRKEEFINFQGNIFKGSNHFPLMWIDATHPLDSAVAETLIRDNIVIIGYMGDYPGHIDLLSLFYSSLNDKPLGRAYPDMYGMVVHANIIETIIDGNYVNPLNNTGEFLVALLATFLHILFLIWGHRRFPKMFDLITVAAVIAQLFVFAGLRYFLFLWFNIKASLALTLASMVIAGVMVGLYFNIWPLVRNTLEVKSLKQADQHILDRWIWAINVTVTLTAFAWAFAANAVSIFNAFMYPLSIVYFIWWSILRITRSPKANTVGAMAFIATVGPMPLMVLLMDLVGS